MRVTQLGQGRHFDRRLALLVRVEINPTIQRHDACLCQQVLDGPLSVVLLDLFRQGTDSDCQSNIVTSDL